MAQTRRLLCFVLVSLYCLTHSVLVIASDNDGLSSKIDNDLFLDDDVGSGSRGIDDLEISGSGNGFGDDDEDTVTVKSHPPVTTPKSSKRPEDIIGRNTENERVEDDLDFTNGGEGSSTNGNIFNQKPDSSTSFFSQPGILAAIICGAIVGLLFAILVVMFVVYRLRKKDEGSYVLDTDTNKRSASYGKSKEFFA